MRRKGKYIYTVQNYIIFKIANTCFAAKCSASFLDEHGGPV
jgi:hypothetical protein